MANILTVPESGIFFDGNTAGNAIVPVLTGNASGVAIKYNGYAGVEVNSSASGINYLDRFSVDGSNGRLFSVTDEVTGIIFSVNDAAGLPIIEVESTSGYDKITIGEFGTNALVVSGSNVGIGTTSPSEKLHIKQGNILLESSSVSSPAQAPYILFDEQGFDDRFFIGCDFAGAASSDNKLFFGANNDGGVPDDSDAKIAILQGGNVGIGTNTPDVKLHVSGDTTVSGGLTTLGKTTLSSDAFVTETGNFTLGATHKGATVFLQNPSSITITAPAQTAGYVTTFIAETQNTVSFATGAGISGLNSFAGASDMAGIFAQAQIIYKSSSGAFLGGNIV